MPLFACLCSSDKKIDHPTVRSVGLRGGDNRLPARHGVACLMPDDGVRRLPSVGYGVSVGMAMEYSFFVLQSKFSDFKGSGGIVGVGVARGELAVGARVLAGYREVQSQKCWTVLVALTFRLPASIGVVWAKIH